MTQWGMLLICVYIGLGAAGRLTWRKAGRIALGVTTVVIAAAIVSYMHTTPTDKYYRNVDASVYATGYPYGTPTTSSPIGTPSSQSTEDTTGVQPANYKNTVAGIPAAGSSSNGGAGS
jgi:hypothetical protein